MRARPPNPESDIIAIQWGVKDGFPLCCIAQYVNDHYNPETYSSGLIRRGNAYSESGRSFYVPCFDCDPACGKETVFRGSRAWLIRRPKPLILPTPIEVR